MDPPGVSNETVHGSEQGFIWIRQEATIVTLDTIKNKNKYVLLCEVLQYRPIPQVLVLETK